MNNLMKRVVVIGAASTLLACAQFGYLQHSEIPVNADEAYAMGRQHHLLLRPEQALASYQAALRASPEHVRARNGLAALHADQGRYDEAIALWKSMTVSAAGADSAFLYSNLGYAYALRGDLAEAETALQKACVLDPLNPRAWTHLGVVLERMGDFKRAKKMRAQAATLIGHDLKSDYALVPPGSIASPEPLAGALANVGQDAAGQAAAGQWATTDIRQAENGVFMVKRVPASAPLTPTVVVAAEMPAVPATDFALPTQMNRRVLLEITNGNGVAGMASLLARSVGPHVRVVRLSNQKGYTVKETRVEYQLQYRAAAEKLAERYGASRMVVVGDTGKAEVRLVLGRDMLRFANAPGRPVAQGASSAVRASLPFSASLTRASR